MCRNQRRILTATSHFPNTENGQTFWGSWCCNMSGEVLLQTPTPCQPGFVTAMVSSTGRILHSHCTLLLLNPLSAQHTGCKKYRWAQVTSQSLRAACHQPRFKFFWARSIQEAGRFALHLAGTRLRDRPAGQSATLPGTDLRFPP